MSKITNDGLARSGTGCFIAVPVWQQWASKVKVKPKAVRFDAAPIPATIAFHSPAVGDCQQAVSTSTKTSM